MRTKGKALPILLWGLGTLVLLVCCGQASSPNTNAKETPTPALVIITADPTKWAATRMALPDRNATLSASNAVTLTALAQTPLPTPLATPPPNGTGIIIGKTDEAGVRALLGAPSHIYTRDGSTYWSFNSALSPRVMEVEFGQGIVSRIEIDPDRSLTVNDIISDYGPPDLVGLIESSFPQESPSTSIHTGYIFYPAQGLEFFFDCRNNADYKCHGISQNNRILYVTYFVPMSVPAWLSSEKPDREYILALWSGFSESTP